MADLAQYRVQNGERSNYAKFDGLANTVQSALQNIGDDAKTQWGSGTIFDPAKFMQNAATMGQALLWTGEKWEPASVPSRATFQTTATVDVVNDATQKDLFTGNAAGVTAGYATTVPTGTTRLRLVAGGDFLNNSGSGRKITLGVCIYDGAALRTLWADQSPNIALSANRRSWRLRVDLVTAVSGTSVAYTGQGVFSMSDVQAATAGLGCLQTPANSSLWAPIYPSFTLTSPSAARVQFTITHEAANANLSMRCLLARLEVLS